MQRDGADALSEQILPRNGLCALLKPWMLISMREGPQWSKRVCLCVLQHKAHLGDETRCMASCHDHGRRAEEL